MKLTIHITEWHLKPLLTDYAYYDMKIGRWYSKTFSFLFITIYY